MENNEKLIKRIAIFYTFIMGFFQFADKMYGASYMVKMNKQGIDVSTIGIIIAFEEFILVISDYPSGLISDFIGRKKTAALSMIGYGIGMLLFARANNVFMYFLAMFVIAISMAMYSGSPQTWFYDTLVKLKVLHLREKMIPKMNGVVSGFSIISSLAAYVLISKSILWPLYLGAFITIIIGILFLLFFEDNKGAVEEESLITLFVKFSSSFIKDKRMRSIVVMEMFEYTSFSIFIFVWQLYLMNQYGLKENFISIMLVILMAAMMFGHFIAGKLMRRTSLFITSYIGKSLIALAFISLVFSKNLYVAIMSLILYDFACSIVGSSCSIWENDYISSDNRATYNSAISSIKTIMSIGVTISMGFIVNYMGYNGAWFIAVIFEILSILALYYFISRYEVMKEVDNVNV